MFWTINDMGTAQATYGPTVIPSADLANMTTNFGIAVDPMCHYYGTLQLDYVIGSQSVEPPNPVPEPTSLLLLGTGLAGIGIAVWRRKK